MTEVPTVGLGMSSVYVSDAKHRYVIEATEDEAINSEFQCEPLTAFTYKVPDKSQERDLDFGRAIDETNSEIFEHNRRIVQLINPILAALHHRSVAAHPPTQSYAQLARLKYKEWLEDPTVRLREAIKFLEARGGFNVATDLDDAPDKADQMAEYEEMQRLKDHWKMEIPVTVDGVKGSWDGSSERDSAKRRVRWHITPYHSFLKPHIIPEVF